MNIAIDVDEVLAEFMGPYLNRFNRMHNTNHEIKDITDYDLSVILKVGRNEFKEDLSYLEKSDWFRKLPLIHGAEKYMKELYDKGHRLNIVTSRTMDTRTDIWLRNNNMPYNALYYMNDKTPVFNKSDVVIDDSPHHLENALSLDKKVIVMARPWNKEWRKNNKVYEANDFEDAYRIIEGLQ